MDNNILQFQGLSDSQVEESRIENGENILTPPEKMSFWNRVRVCFGYWLLKLEIILWMISALTVCVGHWSSLLHLEYMWVVPTLLIVLFLLTFLIAFLGGNWDETNHTYKIDSLFSILLFTLLLSGVVACYKTISYYNGIDGGEPGVSPYLDLIGIAMAVLLATVVTRVLESQNEKTFECLNEVNDDTLVKVVRNNNVCQVPRRSIVVGDIIFLEAGEEIPADGELLQSMNLCVDESSLTGEPSCHKTTDPLKFDKQAPYASNKIMKGCIVLEGDCIAKVVAVGDATACGMVYHAAQVKDGETTPLGEKLDKLSQIITKISYSLAFVIVLGRLFRYALLLPSVEPKLFSVIMIVSLLLAVGITFFLSKRWNSSDNEGAVLYRALVFMLLPTIGLLCYFVIGEAKNSVYWPDLVQYSLDSIMIAITLIVVAVPEGLPMAVTLSLAFNMKRLMSQNTLPRTMHSCETMGAVSVICSDKTGTLTQNRMKVVATSFVDGCGDSQQSNPLVNECIAVNTTANLDFSCQSQIVPVGNPTEGALLLWMYAQGVSYIDIRNTHQTVDRLQFSTDLKYMATVAISKITNKKTVYVKGAPDILLEKCNASQEEKHHFQDILIEYQRHSYRTLAFAYRELDDLEEVFSNGTLCVSDLNFLGVVGIEDPIRPGVPEAILECLEAGIQVKIVTGDSQGTAKEIGRQLGLWQSFDKDECILSGAQISTMTDAELKVLLPKVKIISRARPNDKERVVRVLRSSGHVVAVTGDGTNDAPALNAANVGLSMGDGTAVAKEASDMTIVDNSFSTIANAVMWGRSLYKNIQRFILFQMTVNVVACLIVVAGAFWGETSPLTVTQMLWVNLIMDTFAALALASLPPAKSVMTEEPRPIKEHILKGIWFDILVTGILFFVSLFVIYLFFLHSNVCSLGDVFLGKNDWGGYDGLSDYESSLFFTIFIMLQFWNLFNAKAFMTQTSAFRGLSWHNTKGFFSIMMIIVFGQVIITECPGFQEMFNLSKEGLSFVDWLIIIGSTSVVLWIGEFVRFFKKEVSPMGLMVSRMNLRF